MAEPVNGISMVKIMMAKAMSEAMKMGGRMFIEFHRYISHLKASHAFRLGTWVGYPLGFSLLHHADRSVIAGCSVGITIDEVEAYLSRSMAGINAVAARCPSGVGGVRSGVLVQAPRAC